jgi:predicted GNAT family N-acyltransferase
MNVVLAKTQKEITDNFYVRGLVFVLEQEIDYEIEFDGLDGECALFVCYKDGKPVGAARLYKNKVGRVATLKKYRKQGVAKAIMLYIEEYAKSIGLKQLKLHAQLYVKEFYENLNYIAIGDIFQEAEIDHIKMYKDL